MSKVRYCRSRNIHIRIRIQSLCSQREEHDEVHPNFWLSYTRVWPVSPVCG